MRGRLDRFAVVAIDAFRAADAELLRLAGVLAADFAASLAVIGRVVRRAFGRRA